MPVGEPDESQQHLPVCGQRITEQRLMDTVGFTNLPLDPVTVDSMMEALLRNTDEQLNRFCP